ncbi:MAG: hypothetical protein PHV51_04975 [Methanosarcinaceae archaeon]|nr:hypothetical protein [Methanosarcinaceae archaeon]
MGKIINETIKCQKCGREVPAEECVKEGSLDFCEECYMDTHQQIKACDPWAVRSKKLFREEAGLEGSEGLTDLQKKIYEFILSRGGAKPEELARELGIAPREINNQFALLRHCELLKGQKREDGVYLVPFES